LRIARQRMCTHGMKQHARVPSGCKSKVDSLAWNEEVAGALPAILTNFNGDYGVIVAI
jgi:hypothetical protein